MSLMKTFLGMNDSLGYMREMMRRMMDNEYQVDDEIPIMWVSQISKEG